MSWANAVQIHKTITMTDYRTPLGTKFSSGSLNMNFEHVDKKTAI